MPACGALRGRVRQSRERATDLATAAREGRLSIPVGERFDIPDAPKAHNGVDRGVRERVLLRIPA